MCCDSSKMKKNIILIISLISFALIGLMVIQVYWIKNAIKVEESSFVRNVDDAVSKVVIKLEKIEMSKQLQRKMRINTRRSNMLQSIDSLKNNFNSSIGGTTKHELFMQQSRLAQDVFQNFMDFNKIVTIEEKLNRKILDSLLTIELKNKGIITQFEFGVFNPASNRLIFQKTGRYPNELLNKGFAFTLYPSEMQINPSYLMMYFPNMKRFLISRLWVLLSISVVLIFVIILSFAFTIYTIFRQKKLSEIKNDFINNMTHEFKTPISTISLACEALKDKDIRKSEDIYETYIRMIDEENKRLGGMAEKVLQTAVLDKGRLSLKKESVNIHKVILNTIKNVKLQVERKNGKIITGLKADYCMLNADKMHITNVIYNLLDNANKYTLEDPEIIISTENAGGGINITISDNGIGISKTDQKRIFEKLYRVSTGNVHDFKGFGLGLNYVKAIVEKHGGKITLESELKKGTEFIIFLPLENN